MNLSPFSVQVCSITSGIGLRVSLVKVCVVVSPTVLPTPAVCMLSVLWKTQGKFSMPPIRPGQLEWFAVKTTLGCEMMVPLQVTLGLGPVSVTMTGPAVTACSTLGASMLVPDMLRNMLVLRTVLVRAATWWAAVNLCPTLPTLAWQAAIMFRSL